MFCNHYLVPDSQAQSADSNCGDPGCVELAGILGALLAIPFVDHPSHRVTCGITRKGGLKTEPTTGEEECPHQPPSRRRQVASHDLIAHVARDSRQGLVLMALFSSQRSRHPVLRVPTPQPQHSQLRQFPRPNPATALLVCAVPRPTSCPGQLMRPEIHQNPAGDGAVTAGSVAADPRGTAASSRCPRARRCGNADVEAGQVE